VCHSFGLTVRLVLLPCICSWCAVPLRCLFTHASLIRVPCLLPEARKKPVKPVCLFVSAPNMVPVCASTTHPQTGRAQQPLPVGLDCERGTKWTPTSPLYPTCCAQMVPRNLWHQPAPPLPALPCHGGPLTPCARGGAGGEDQVVVRERGVRPSMPQVEAVEPGSAAAAGQHEVHLPVRV
jgi:hypothetical protein